MNKDDVVDSINDIYEMKGERVKKLFDLEVRVSFLERKIKILEKLGFWLSISTVIFLLGQITSIFLK